MIKHGLRPCLIIFGNLWA